MNRKLILCWSTPTTHELGFAGRILSPILGLKMAYQIASVPFL
jgi:hypothetical protein